MTMQKALYPQADIELRKDISQLKAIKTKENRMQDWEKLEKKCNIRIKKALEVISVKVRRFRFLIWR